MTNAEREALARAWEQYCSRAEPSAIILEPPVNLLVVDSDGHVTVNGLSDKEKTEFVDAHRSRDPEHDRLRAYLLSQLANKSVWDDSSRYDVREALVPVSGYSDDAWVRFEKVRGAVADQWFVFRRPNKPDDMHCDQVLVLPETGEIDGKGGCGLDFYSECQACRFADDVKQAMIAGGQECPI